MAISYQMKLHINLITDQIMYMTGAAADATAMVYCSQLGLLEVNILLLTSTNKSSDIDLLMTNSFARHQRSFLASLFSQLQEPQSKCSIMFNQQWNDMAKNLVLNMIHFQTNYLLEGSLFITSKNNPSESFCKNPSPKIFDNKPSTAGPSENQEPRSFSLTISCCSICAVSSVCLVLKEPRCT